MTSPVARHTRALQLKLAQVERHHFGEPVAIEHRLGYDTMRVQNFIENWVFKARAYREIPGMRSKLLTQLGEALIERARAEDPGFNLLDVISDALGGESD